MTKKAPFFGTVLFILLATVSSGWTQQPLLLRTGHTGAIRDVAAVDDSSLVFTGGQDGKLLVWEPETDRLLQSIHADVLPIERVVPYTDGRRVAVYASNGQRHRITVWDWHTGERLLLHTPNDEVLHMDVSSQGSYLVYSVPRLRSIQILDGRTGRELPFLRQNTGIISWFVIARSEERLMTYAPGSGNLVYRNIVTGTEQGNFSAPGNIRQLSLMTTTRFAAAVLEDGSLGVLDLLSGDIVADTVVGEIQTVQTDPTDGDIVVVARDIRGDSLIRRFRFTDQSLQRRFTTRRDVPEGILAYHVSGRDVFAGTSDGRFLRWLPFEIRPSSMVENTVDPISDFLLDDNTLHLLGRDQVISIRSDFFDRDVSAEETSYVTSAFTRINAASPGRFISDNGRLHLIWLPSERDLALRDFDPRNVEVLQSPLQPPDALTGMDIYNDSVLFLDRSGRVVIQNATTGMPTFNYRGRSIQTAILTSRGVFLGTAAGDIFNSSVLRLDTRTSETVPLDTTTDLVFFLRYDEQRGRLFTIGVRTDNTGRLFTVVEVFEGASFQRSRTIIEIEGEYLEAMLVVDPVTGSAYTTLDDRGGILRWDGTRVSEVRRNPKHIPSRIALDGDYLYSVNRDGTVSVFDRFAGEMIVDIYAVTGAGAGAWIAIRPDGTFLASRDSLGSSRFLSLNDDRLPGLERLQLSVPRTQPVLTPDQGRNRTVPGSRFDSGRDRNGESRDETFDPFSGEPAPSS
jgi:WD40 repeat protein